MNSRDTQKGTTAAALMVIASAVLWGTYGSFVTAISRLGLGRNAQVFLRFLMTALPVGLLMLRRDRSLFRLRKQDLWLFAANAVLSLYFFSACYTAAIAATKIATAAALLYTAPVIVMVLSALLFQEKITPGKVCCILLSVIGCALASGLGSDLAGAHGSSGSVISLTGLLLGLGAGLGYALYSIFSRIILRRGYSVYTNIFYSFLLVMILFGAASMRDGSFQQIFRLPKATLLALLCGLVTGFGSYVLYTLGMERMETSRAAQMATIEPVTAALLGVLLFRQPLSLPEGIGITLVVLSVILMNSRSRRHPA